MLAEVMSYMDIVKSLAKHSTKKYISRSLDSIEAIVIHHSGTEHGDSYGYANYHVNEKKWPGIGYHMVGKDATIALTNKLTTISYHCGGFNSKSVGLCHVGNYDKRAPTDLEYWTYIRMVLITDYLLDRELPITYHNEKRPTTCPGNKFDKQYFEKELQNFRYLVR